MIITLIEKNSDHSGPVLEILSEDINEAFQLGILFQKIANLNMTAWRLETSIRIPLVEMDKHGLAITYKKDL